MTCEPYNLLLHAFVDDEVDARHSNEFEAHMLACRVCAEELRGYREMRRILSGPELHYQAPATLRRRIETALPPLRTSATKPKRRSLMMGFSLGTMASAALAASLAVFIVLGQHDQLAVDELVSAHLRSLQTGRFTDVQSSDQHTVRPWFNDRLEVAPPVIDLTAQGFVLVGGRLDYIDNRPIATLVYKRRAHIINLFIVPGSAATREAKLEPQLQGFNVLRWSKSGFECSAVSDIDPGELEEFGTKFQAAVLRGES
jgi:anti-sigma factor RsiW